MNERGFKLDPRLEADCVGVGNLALCSVLLMNNATLPWLILVPRRPHVEEIFQLNAADRALLMEESHLVGKVLMEEYKGEKLNVAALGNQVRQLHVHHIVRYQDDPCWPNPVWGRIPDQPYSDAALAETVARLQRVLGIGEGGRRDG